MSNSDAGLIREGLAGILERAGHTVAGQATDALGLVSDVNDMMAAGRPLDLVLTDVRMPPDLTDDGLRAAVKLRQRYSGLPILVRSQYVAPAYAKQLFDGRFGGGLGYLPKDRMSNIADFIRSLELIANGGILVDPEVAAGLLRSQGHELSSPISRPRDHS